MSAPTQDAPQRGDRGGREGLSPLARNAIAGLVTLALVVAGALWVWPGFLRQGGPDQASAQAAAESLAQGFLRGDPAAVAQLIPDDGRDRTLLSPEAANAIYGEGASVDVNPTSSSEDEATFDVVIIANTGSTTLKLELDRLQGPNSPWVATPLRAPQLRIYPQVSTLWAGPSRADVTINGKSISLPMSSDGRAVPTLPGTLTFGGPAPKGATSLTFSPRTVALGLSGGASFGQVSVSLGPGPEFAQAAEAAFASYLKACVTPATAKEQICPFAPGPLGRGATQRRNLVYSDPQVDPGVDLPSEGPASRFDLVGTVKSSWEELRSGEWEKASGSYRFEMQGSLLTDGDGLRFEPTDGLNRSFYDAADADTDYGSAYDQRTP